MDSKELERIEKFVDAWDDTVNGQRKLDALALIKEVKRLRKELELAYDGPDVPGGVY